MGNVLWHHFLKAQFSLFIPIRKDILLCVLTWINITMGVAKIENSQIERSFDCVERISLVFTYRNSPAMITDAKFPDGS